MDNFDTVGRSLMLAKQIIIVIYDKIAFLVCPENPTFHLQAGNMKETKLLNTVKENITNLTFFGSIDA